MVVAWFTRVPPLMVRVGNWKMHIGVKKHGSWWNERSYPSVPYLFNLRMDPYERADITSNTYYDWIVDNDYIILAATALVTQFLATFEEFPPRQKAASFTIDQVVEKLEAALTSGR